MGTAEPVISFARLIGTLPSGSATASARRPAQQRQRSCQKGSNRARSACGRAGKTFLDILTTAQSAITCRGSGYFPATVSPDLAAVPGRMRGRSVIWCSLFVPATVAGMSRLWWHAPVPDGLLDPWRSSRRGSATIDRRADIAALSRAVPLLPLPGALSSVASSDISSSGPPALCSAPAASKTEERRQDIFGNATSIFVSHPVERGVIVTVVTGTSLDMP